MYIDVCKGVYRIKTIFRMYVDMLQNILKKIRDVGLHIHGV